MFSLRIKSRENRLIPLITAREIKTMLMTLIVMKFSEVCVAILSMSRFTKRASKISTERGTKKVEILHGNIKANAEL